MSFHSIDRCRSCGGQGLFPVLDLGDQPLANNLRKPDDASPEPRFPLALCGCPSCSLVQLTGTVDPSVLFDSYHYFSSFSTTMIESVGRLAARLVEERRLGPDSLVVEVASNDGYLLQHYVERGVPVLGVDPAANVADVAIERGVPTLVDFFGARVATSIVDDRGRADVIHANNVMAHVPDINDFVAGIAALLAPEGVAVIESPHLLPLIAQREFDTIYHEHVFYYSLTAVRAVLERHGLSVVDVDELPIHGGTLRTYVMHAGPAPGATVERILGEEARLGVDSPDYYAGFAGAVASLRQDTRRFVEELKGDGRSVAAYGAAAKGTVLLNHFGIDHTMIEFVVDRNTHKHGYLMPGVGVPISPVERLLEERPDDVLLLAWNFADEIIGQQAAYLGGGGRFVVPVPELRVVTA